MVIHTWLDYGGGQTGHEMVLTLRLTGSEPAYRFVSWLPEGAAVSAGEAEDWLLQTLELVQIQPNTAGVFTDNGLAVRCSLPHPGRTPANWSPMPC